MSVLPIKGMEKEWETPTAEKYARCNEYYKLNDEIKNVEALRRSAESIIRGDIQERNAARTQGMKL